MMMFMRTILVASAFILATMVPSVAATCPINDPSTNYTLVSDPDGAGPNPFVNMVLTCTYSLTCPENTQAVVRFLSLKNFSIAAFTITLQPKLLTYDIFDPATYSPPATVSNLSWGTSEIAVTFSILATTVAPPSGGFTLTYSCVINTCPLLSGGAGNLTSSTVSTSMLYNTNLTQNGIQLNNNSVQRYMPIPLRALITPPTTPVFPATSLQFAMWYSVPAAASLPSMCYFSYAASTSCPAPFSGQGTNMAMITFVNFPKFPNSGYGPEPGIRQMLAFDTPRLPGVTPWTGGVPFPVVWPDDYTAYEVYYPANRLGELMMKNFAWQGVDVNLTWAIACIETHICPIPPEGTDTSNGPVPVHATYVYGQANQGGVLLSDEDGEGPNYVSTTPMECDWNIICPYDTNIFVSHIGVQFDNGETSGSINYLHLSPPIGNDVQYDYNVFSLDNQQWGAHSLNVKFYHPDLPTSQYGFTLKYLCHAQCGASFAFDSMTNVTDPQTNITTWVPSDPNGKVATNVSIFPDRVVSITDTWTAATVEWADMCRWEVLPKCLPGQSVTMHIIQAPYAAPQAAHQFSRLDAFDDDDAPVNTAAVRYQKPQQHQQRRQFQEQSTSVWKLIIDRYGDEYRFVLPDMSYNMGNDLYFGIPSGSGGYGDGTMTPVQLNASMLESAAGITMGNVPWNISARVFGGNDADFDIEAMCEYQAVCFGPTKPTAEWDSSYPSTTPATYVMPGYPNGVIVSDLDALGPTPGQQGECDVLVVCPHPTDTIYIIKWEASFYGEMSFGNWSFGNVTESLMERHFSGNSWSSGSAVNSKHFHEQKINPVPMPSYIPVATGSTHFYFTSLMSSYNGLRLEYFCQGDNSWLPPKWSHTKTPSLDIITTTPAPTTTTTTTPVPTTTTTTNPIVTTPSTPAATPVPTTATTFTSTTTTPTTTTTTTATSTTTTTTTPVMTPAPTSTTTTPVMTPVPIFTPAPTTTTATTLSTTSKVISTSTTTTSTAIATATTTAPPTTTMFNGTNTTLAPSTTTTAGPHHGVRTRTHTLTLSDHHPPDCMTTYCNAVGTSSAHYDTVTFRCVCDCTIPWNGTSPRCDQCGVGFSGSTCGICAIPNYTYPLCTDELIFAAAEDARRAAALNAEKQKTIILACAIVGGLLFLLCCFCLIFFCLRRTRVAFTDVEIPFFGDGSKYTKGFEIRGDDELERLGKDRAVNDNDGIGMLDVKPALLTPQDRDGDDAVGEL